MACPDPWHACQELGWVLRFAPEAMLGSVTEQLRRRATECRDDYQRSAVRAWEIRALAERGLVSEAGAALNEAIYVARQVRPNSSRSEALLLLLQAAHSLGDQAFAPLMAQLFQCQETLCHWRVEMNLVRAMELLAFADSQRAEPYLERAGSARLRARIQRALQRPIAGPRLFFW